MAKVPELRSPGTSMTTPAQVAQPPHAQMAEASPSFQGQLIESWPEIDASYSQLDTAFHDMFDYGMPYVFRDPATWDFLHTTNSEDGATGGEYQFPSTFTSPEMEFGSYPSL